MINNNDATPPILGYVQLKKLRTALAILQGTKLLSTLQHEAESTVSHDQTKRVTYLTNLFSQIHRDMFHDWKEQATVGHRPGSMTDANKRQEFRKTIACLVLDDHENHENTAIFDNNGFVIKTADIANRLAIFYQEMRSVRPFDYGNRITLDFFITMIGKLPAFKSVYEQQIDFRRLEATDTIALHNPNSSLQDITRAFEHALDPTRTKTLLNNANGYGKWPENKKFIAGIPFLSHTTTSGVCCLVAVNGGLVPLNSIKEEIFSAGKHLADYPLCEPHNIIGYLPGTEDLRAADKAEIDGISMGANGAAPLFCLDINMLSGLRSPSHTELMELLKQCDGDKAGLFKLANNIPLKNKLLNAADGDDRLERSVEIAYERLGKIIKILEEAKNVLFEGKKPSLHPQLFMAMGGAGSGKTAVEEMAYAQCGDNFVIASLDEFRKKSDLYRVLTTANHHSDDYVYVEPFANKLRDMVASQAKKWCINILYDGTGIPYKPRYSTIVEYFKEADFDTQMIAVDAFIVKPEGREDELSRSGVIGSVKERFDKTGRALPWVITVYKHIRVPESFLYALEDQNLDKLSLFANDGEKDKHYLVAESFDFSNQEIEDLQTHQMKGDLAPYLKKLMKEHKNSTLRKLAQQDEKEIEALMARNPALEENNVAYQIYPGKDDNRVLLIYNVARMVDFVKKRQLNPNASGEEGLLHKPESLAFHVDPLAEKPWITRLQGSLA
jgi:fido (protein-threonine AMPylation protein)